MEGLEAENAGDNSRKESASSGPKQIAPLTYAVDQSFESSYLPESGAAFEPESTLASKLSKLQVHKSVCILMYIGCRGR